MSRLEDHDRLTFELIRIEVSALDNGGAQPVLSGPPGILLRSSLVQTLAIALHELVTNAVKYGALSQAKGQLVVAWALRQEGLDGQRWLHID